MDQQDLVSIIIPVYNAGDYLKNSVESVLAQTYTNLEVILIDDHSTDQHTLDLLHEYEKKDPRIKLILSPENHGVSYSRNFAVAQCKGKYLTFLDNDDSFSHDYVEKMHEALVTHDADFVICDAINYALPHSKAVFDPNEMFFPEQDQPAYSTKEFADAHKLLYIPVMPFAKMFNTQKYREAELNFVEGMIAEDHDWTLRLFFKLDKVAIIRFTGVHRLVLEHSSSRTVSPFLRSCVLKSIRLRYEVLKEFGYLDMYRNDLFNRAMDHLNFIAKQILDLQQRIEFIKEGISLLKELGYELPETPTSSLILQYKLKYKLSKLTGNLDNKRLYKAFYHLYKNYFDYLAQAAKAA